MADFPKPIKRPFDLPVSTNAGKAFEESIGTVSKVVGAVANTAYDVSQNVIRIKQLFDGDVPDEAVIEEKRQESKPITSYSISEGFKINPQLIGVGLGIIGLFLLFGKD